MTKTFTHNELIQYVYNELPFELREPLEKALQIDQMLAENCAELLASKRTLDRLSPKPGEACINNILMYSQNLSLLS
jgi:hypothetical protein